MRGNRGCQLTFFFRYLFFLLASCDSNSSDRTISVYGSSVVLRVEIESTERPKFGNRKKKHHWRPRNALNSTSFFPPTSSQLSLRRPSRPA